jgi:hypothetical protein
MNNIGKGLASIALGCLCGFMMYFTQGAHGIGWFIGGLFVIWCVA